MNRRGIALFLAVAMTLSLCVVSVLAAGQTEETPVASETQGIAETAAPDTAPAPESPEGSAEAAEPAASGEAQPDPAGTLSFDNLERRLREGNCNLLALDETIASIEALDYDEMYDDLRDSLNDIADAQWMLIQFGMSDSTPPAPSSRAISPCGTLLTPLKTASCSRTTPTLCFSSAMRRIKSSRRPSPFTWLCWRWTSTAVRWTAP